jgi:N-acetyl-alpha-D-glucosaminyl L-malate synthase BshA
MPVRSEIVVIPNFLDCTFHRRTPDAKLRAVFCPDDEKLVVHISNLRPVKQVDAVVRVFARIRQQVAARLLIVGEGPERGKATQLVRALDLEPYVEMVGETQDVVGVLSAADLFLLPSLQESFGLSALEAMACGVPVVASRVGGLPEVVEDGVTGCLHPPDAVEAMAECAVEIMSDDDLRVRMADAGVRVAREKFSADRVVPLYETLYRETIG